jgi:GDP-D-mannose dehydratase
VKKKVALIFGITGQDGAYLSRFLKQDRQPYPIQIAAL